MDHREGADKTGDVRLDFDRRVRLEFHGSKISSNGGLLLFRELDEVLGLHDMPLCRRTQPPISNAGDRKAVSGSWSNRVTGCQNIRLAGATCWYQYFGSTP